MAVQFVETKCVLITVGPRFRLCGKRKGEGYLYCRVLLRPAPFQLFSVVPYRHRFVSEQLFLLVLRGGCECWCVSTATGRGGQRREASCLSTGLTTPGAATSGAAPARTCYLCCFMCLLVANSSPPFEAKRVRPGESAEEETSTTRLSCPGPAAGRWTGLTFLPAAMPSFILVPYPVRMSRPRHSHSSAIFEFGPAPAAARS